MKLNVVSECSWLGRMSWPSEEPVNDATDMAAALRKAGFTVVLKKDANLETMEQAIEDFGNRLKRGGVGLSIMLAMEFR